MAGSTCFTAPEQTRVAIGPRKHGTLHGQVACFPGGKPFLARKVAFGPRGHAKTRRGPRYFRTVNPAPGGIRTYIYIEASVVALILKLILDAAASCGRGRVRCLERAKRACSSQTVLAGAQAWLRLALIRAAIWLPRTTIGRCSSRRCVSLCMLCSRAGVAPGLASVLGPSFAPLAVHAAWTLP